MPSGIVQLRRPRAIVFDILGTASKSGFLERILFPFLKLNLETYLNTHWDKHDFIKLYKRIQDNSIEYNSKDPNCPVVLAHSTGIQAAKPSLMAFLNHCIELNYQPPAVTQLRFKVWFEGYQTSRLLTPIYADVPASMRRWFAEGIKFYVFSNTWVEAQKALLRNTTHGDLTNLITGHYDNEFGLLTEPDSWRRFCAEINQSPNNVLFLTKAPTEARAAQDTGLAVCLVLTHRHNVKALTHEDRNRFPYVRTLVDLQWLESGGASAAGQQGESGASGLAGGVATGASVAAPGVSTRRYPSGAVLSGGQLASSTVPSRSLVGASSAAQAAAAAGSGAGSMMSGSGAVGSGAQPSAHSQSGAANRGSMVTQAGSRQSSRQSSGGRRQA